MEANPLVHPKRGGGGGRRNVCALYGCQLLIFRKFITQNGNILIPLFGIFAILVGSNTGTREGGWAGRLVYIHLNVYSEELGPFQF